MSKEIISEEELNFIETWHTPQALLELLFHNWDNLNAFDTKRIGELRLYQAPMLSDESLIDFDLTAELEHLDKQEIFTCRKKVGDIYCFGARKFGKSLITMIMDLIVQMLTNPADKVALGSVDLIHLRQILDPIKNCFETHPICKMWKKRITGAPDFKIELKNDWVLNSVNFNIGSKSPGCFSDDTEVLTNEGWKFFKDLTGQEKVLSVEPITRKADYFSIKKVIKSPYNGNLVSVNNSDLEFLVTPNHKFLFNENGKDFLQEIQDVNRKQFYIANVINWNGENQETITFSGIVNSKEKSLTVKMEDWVRFVAWYLAEGSLFKSHHMGVEIPQKKYKDEVFECISKIGYCSVHTSPSDNGLTRYKLHSKLVYEHLLKNCGKVKEKRVPQYIKNLSPKYLQIFLDAYLLGDGNSRNRNGNCLEQSVFSTVKLLADDLQEIVIKAGYKANMRVGHPIGFDKLKHDMFIINIGNSKNSFFERSKLSSQWYEGYVYCIETEPHHTIYVRRNGRTLISGNSQFFGKHVYRLYVEEASLETEQVYEKRKDALSEMGAVFRISGMTNFTVHSPAGNVFYDRKLKQHILNLSQYVNPTFNEDKQKKAEEDYGGKSSIGYRVYVDGEIVEDAVSVFDMERVRRLCIDEKKTVKTIEISKDQFKFFRQFIVCDRPNNSERIFITSDIGIHTTEVGIFSEIENKYEYLYNITLHNLTDDEQATIFKYLAEVMTTNVIGIDCGDGMGRAIYNELEKTISKDNLVWYDGSMKVNIGFETDQDGKVIFKNGIPEPKMEIMAEWSVKRLKDLFYDGLMIIPEDYKFLSQFGQVISTVSGTRILYKCNSPQGDHLFDMFKVFSISQWLCSDANKTPDVSSSWGGGINGELDVKKII